jgi:hypothetical protein
MRLNNAMDFAARKACRTTPGKRAAFRRFRRDGEGSLTFQTPGRSGVLEVLATSATPFLP